MVWRYMRLSRFLWMFKESKLYFSRAAQFKNDPYEGTIPFPSAGQIAENQKAAYGLQRRLAAISCWHMNEVESVAMWKLYVEGPEAVAIQSRISALKKLDERSPFVIGKVKYINYETEPQPRFVEPLLRLQPYLPIFQKRQSYQHEQEVRVVILNPGDIPGERVIPPERNMESTGFGVPVRLPELVERIVVSPEFPPFAITSLQKDVDSAGLKVSVEKSDLLKQPDKECEEALLRLARLSVGRT